MKAPSHSDAFDVLCLSIADDGREEVLFGDSVPRAREAVRPFVVGKDFPDIYFEFPLIGDPFLDVTLLYGELEPGDYIDSPAAEGTEQLFDWWRSVQGKHSGASFGFELDTKRADVPAAAIHFQPRSHHELVEPFCEVVGEPERAELYLGRARSMSMGWPLSFFGMFRGRPGSDLRICGYLADEEKRACAQDSGRLAAAFDMMGFTAYDDAMLAQVSELMGAAPGTVDFQFDLHPDGTMGETFAIDVQFEIEQPEAVRASFREGACAHVMELLESWGVADGRWRAGIDAVFAKGLPVELDDGSVGRYAFVIMPQWVKARWRGARLQPSKLYHLGNAGVVG